MSLSYGFGYIPDVEDDRDYCFKSVRSSLVCDSKTQSTELYEIPNWRPARTQVGNSCVANAWCRALEILSDRQGTPIAPLSAQALYWFSRYSHGAERVDHGTYLRQTAKALADFGVCPSSDWPDAPDTLSTQPTIQASMDGYDARIKSYYRASASDFDSLEYALRANHPIVAGLAVGSDFMNYRGPSTEALSPPTSLLGYHAICIVGVRQRCGERQWKLINSWGDRWGLLGYAWISSEYMRSARDVWVATRAPT